MYDLREPVFELAFGRKDDRPYLTLSRLSQLLERAGGAVLRSSTLEVNLPHALAYFPRSLVESIPDPRRREVLLHRWDDAEALRRRHGADHPPVGLVLARRS